MDDNWQPLTIVGLILKNATFVHLYGILTKVGLRFFKCTTFVYTQQLTSIINHHYDKNQK